MINNIKFFWEVLKESFTEWNNSSASRDSAGLAYYAIFSIPGLLIIIIWIAGNFFGEEAIRGQISSEISGIMGADVAKSIQDMIAGALIDKQNVFMKAVGVGSLVFGSTTLFFQLQHTLNTLWDVQAAPKKAFTKFLLDRANSLGMILILGFLLMITMVLSSLISVFNNLITRYFGFETYMLVELVNFGVGFGFVMLLFAMMFKILPDVQVSWKPVWKGAFLTAVLFTLGKFLLSLYFGTAKPTSAFGTAGTVILIMMWINYSCMLIFFGAVYTKVYAYKKGYTIIPSKHAKWSDAKLYEETQRKKENENIS
ncbi:YihY/virulence factor BrkB family protein [Chryseobacterium fluminis]|uniref:YihY/virulence factor BrkB family protein n=1 Tax=Chryseobacterium fluminis TaxID=2983606 RepID=UPI0022501C8F|nr:YihY/virulence factor BrkB family protein [Chryseobacterium sp. MMS21-Ot14]UZU00063.1 YihY/virulence factor BrkB family protein [Chryseobacterium sp. MMS21-Ot14]